MEKYGLLTTHKYITFEFIFSFFVAFLFFFFIFFVNQLLLLAEEILSKNVSIKNVLLIILYSIPAIISFTFPFSSLVGALMSIGRLSSDNEILALQAAGIRYRQIFLPLLLMGILLSSLSFVINDYFLPLSTVKFGKLYREILYSTPELELNSYSVKRYQDSIIISGLVKENKINNLVIIDHTSRKDKRVITASQAVLIPNSSQSGISSMELEKVFSITPSSRERGKFNYFDSEMMIYNILLNNLTFSLKSLTPREMSLLDIHKEIVKKRNNLIQKKETNLFRINEYRNILLKDYQTIYNENNNNYTQMDSTLNTIKKLKNKNIFDRNLQIYKLEFNKKLSITLSCIIFIFFAFPVSLYSRKSGRSVGFGIGLFVSVIYWSMLFAGQTFGIRMNFSPFLSMWIPNIVILVLGIIFMRKRLRR